jgi:hypothetical protein
MDLARSKGVGRVQGEKRCTINIRSPQSENTR